MLDINVPFFNKGGLCLVERFIYTVNCADSSISVKLFLSILVYTGVSPVDMV